jgi:hypothetical protein
MKRINFLVVMSIIMFIATSTVVYLGFTVLPATGKNLMLICMMSAMGYLASYSYYSLYKQSKK